MLFEEITRINEDMFTWLRENNQTPEHLKVIKENIINNLKNNCSLRDSLKGELADHDTILNSQLRMHASAVKNRCCIIRIICYVQNFFANLWSGTLNSFFRYTFFLPMINVDVWDSRYSIETMRRARRDFANAIIGQFEEDLTTLIGKNVTVKRWMTDNHPDRNPSNDEKYKQVDELRQLIQEMQKFVAAMGDPSAIQETALKETVVPPTEDTEPQDLAPPAEHTEDQVTPPPVDAAPQELAATDAIAQEAVATPVQYSLTHAAQCATDMPD